MQLFAAAWFIFAGMAPTWSATDEPSYWRDVRPLFRKHCTACHSARNLQDLEVSGGLALDSYEAVRKGNKLPVVRPGDAQASRLHAVLVSTDPEKRMPLAAPPVPEDGIQLIKRWIEVGAPEGTRPAAEGEPSLTRAARKGRKLPVALAVTATVPKGFAKLQGGRLDVRLPAGPLAPITALAFSPDGKELAAGSYHQAALWRLDHLHAPRAWSQVLGAVNDVRYSPDGQWLAVAGGQHAAKGDLRIFSASDGRLVASLRGHEDAVFAIAFHPTGKQLASASFDKTIRIWDLKSFRQERALTGHSDFVYGVAYSADGRLLASCSKDRSVKVVDASTGASRFTLSGGDQDVIAVAFGPDGKSLVSSGLEPGLAWWSLETGQRMRLQGGHSVAVHEIAVSRDGKFLASAGGDRTVRLWSGGGGAPARTLQAGSLVYSVALSPDSKLVAGGCFDGQIRIWEAASGRLLAMLLNDGAQWLAYTPEGHVAGSGEWLASLSWQVAGQPASPASLRAVLEQPALVVKALEAAKPQPPKWTP